MNGTIYSSTLDFSRVARINVNMQIMPNYTNKTYSLRMKLNDGESLITVGSNITGTTTIANRGFDVNVSHLEKLELILIPYSQWNYFMYGHSTSVAKNGEVTVSYNANNRVDPNDAFLQTHSFLVDE